MRVKYKDVPEEYKEFYLNTVYLNTPEGCISLKNALLKGYDCTKGFDTILEINDNDKHNGITK